MLEFLVDMGPRAGVPFTQTALALARRLDAFVTGVQVLPTQPAVALSFEAALLEAEERTALDRREGWLRQCAEAGVAGEWEVLRGEAAPALSKRSRLADLLWLEVSVAGGARDERSPEPTRALLEAAAPVMLVPSTWKGAMARRIVIAWNGSAQAASAARSALPLLATAEQVCVLDGEQACLPGITPSPLPLRAWLKRHGIEPLWQPLDRDRRHAESLDEVAGRMQADLLVMGAMGPAGDGAFGRGGAGRGWLEHVVRPVLLAH
jgi:hypothetical protein